MSQQKSITRKVIEFLDDDDITLWSAGLTFFTIFSTIPLMIILLSLFTNMPIFHEMYSDFKNLVFEVLLPQKSESVITYIDQFVLSGADIGLQYYFYMFFITVFFFKDYEHVVSRMFGKENRGYLKIIGIYIALLIITPVAFILFFYMAEWMGMKFIAFLFAWALFFGLYFISAIDVHKISYIISSSLLTSSIWFTTKTLFVYYVSFNTTYTTLYGSFSTIFIALFWIYLSWMIFLYGLKLIKELEHHVSNQTL